METRKLTPEEEIELAELEQLEGGGLVPTSELGEPAKLSAEDEADLAELEALEAQEAANKPSILESTIRGAAQGATFGWIDEVTGALEAAKDVAIGGTSFSEFHTQYKKHRDESREAYSGAERANPASYTAGQVAGAVGSIFLPGGALARAGGASLKAAAGVGAIEGLGMADEVTDVGTVATHAALGAAGYGAGKLIAKGATKLHSLVKKPTEDLAKEKVALTYRTLGIRPEKDIEPIIQQMKKDGLTWDSWADTLFKNAKEADLQDPRTVSKFINNRIKSLKGSEKKLYADIDGEIPEGIIDSKDLLARIQRDALKAAKKVESVEGQAEFQNLFSYIDTVDLKPEMTIKEAQKFTNYAKSFFEGTDDVGAQELRKRIGKTTKDFIRDQVDVKLAGSELAETFEKKSVELNVLETVQDAAYENRKRDHLIKHQLGQAALDLDERLTSVSKLANFFPVSKMAVKALSFTLKQIAKSQPSSNRKLQSLLTVADGVDLNPEKYSANVMRIFSAAGRNIDGLIEELGVLEASINLDNFPVDRTLSDMKARMPDILSVLKSEDNSLYKVAKEAYETGDDNTIRDIMSKLARAKPQWVKPGFGIDGRIGDDIEAQEMTALVDQNDWSNIQKISAKKSINLGVATIDFNEPYRSTYQYKKQMKMRDKKGKKIYTV